MGMNDLESSGQLGQPDLALEMLRPMAVHSESDIMYLVSPDCDILMLNAGFEAVWQRPATTFFGKKCYREIEKRQERCPHCPGVVALRTGTMAEAESYAVLDDGTRVPFLLRAYPLYGANGEPAGFVETAEDISERRRSEDDARCEVALASDLLATSSTSRVLRLGLDAALQIEAADSGCVFTIDPATGTRQLLAQRGALPADLEPQSPPVTGITVRTREGESLLVRVPVACGGEPVAELVARVSGDARRWSTSQSRLEALASVLTSALTRIRAERLRGDATVNVQTIINAMPLPVFCLDGHGMVTVWNGGSERMFGWSGCEALKHTPPFVPDGNGERFVALVSEARNAPESQGFSFRCLHRDGSASDVGFKAIPIRDLLGDGSAYLVIVTTTGLDAPPAAGSTAGADDAAQSVAAGSARVSHLASEDMDQDALAAAQALGRLLLTLWRSLAATREPGAGLAPTDTDAREHDGEDGGQAGGNMSISWTADGELDIHVRLSAADQRPARIIPSARALVIQADEEDGRRLETILQDLGCPAAVCASAPAALEYLREPRGGLRPPELAFIDMVMPGGPSGLETAKLLTAMDPKLRVVVSSDAGVAGHAAHGFVAAISRPYTGEKVLRALDQALGQQAR